MTTLTTRSHAWSAISERTWPPTAPPATRKPTPARSSSTRFFASLGWDVYNAQHAAPDYREVIVEPSQDVEGHQGARLRLPHRARDASSSSRPRSPASTSKSDAGPAYQLRRYAWSAKLPLSILTDFEEFAVYDCRKRPSDRDKASVARIEVPAPASEYADRWRRDLGRLLADAVLGGSFDQYAAGTRASAAPARWTRSSSRRSKAGATLLARNIALRNPRLSRRRAERRRAAHHRPHHLPAHGRRPRHGAVRAAASACRRRRDLRRPARPVPPGRRPSTTPACSTSPDSRTSPTTSPGLAMDDKVLKPSCRACTSRNRPTSSASCRAEILGQRLRAIPRQGHPADGRASGQGRGEAGSAKGGRRLLHARLHRRLHRQAHGGQAIAGKSPASSCASFRVLDMACGSGSFLLGAYQYLLDYYLQWYSSTIAGEDSTARPRRITGPLHTAKAGG